MRRLTLRSGGLPSAVAELKRYTSRTIKEAVDGESND
jgi:hypothetical protein